MPRVTRLSIALVFVAASAAASPIDENKLVDLTHAFDDKAIYWPTAKPFVWEKESWGVNAEGKWYTAGRYSRASMAGPTSTLRSTFPKASRPPTRFRSPGWSAQPS